MLRCLRRVIPDSFSVFFFYTLSCASFTWISPPLVGCSWRWRDVHCAIRRGATPGCLWYERTAGVPLYAYISHLCMFECSYIYLYIHIYVWFSLLLTGAARLDKVDLRTKHSWLLKLHEISTPELAEVFIINTLAPFILNRWGRKRIAYVYIDK